ncbi:TIL domain-containing protein [Caerostris extrusa]|uniref:TIL domain-containing protein n=1 Tax=Caerostris extrusa TaxID=172846 RepID=A0AAV4W1R1_CAEEX|nr:TIL domain-containing protein [Caerostris extrusa]
MRKSCDQYTNEFEDCPEECVKGCFCRKGFVRGPMRNCIRPRKCKSENFLEPWFLINSRKSSGKLIQQDQIKRERNFRK